MSKNYDTTKVLDIITNDLRRRVGEFEGKMEVDHVNGEQHAFLNGIVHGLKLSEAVIEGTKEFLIKRGVEL